MVSGNIQKTTTKKERIAVIILLAAILLLYAFFLKDILIPFLKLEAKHDLEGANELLLSKGFFGSLAVILVEAMQMVVVFIPAEFIQISSGLSYPLYLSLLLCDLGVCLGATIIYLLVHISGFQSSAYRKNREKIEHLYVSMHERNTVIFMYLLFFMPIIPFGAICYYGSGSKLSYGKYIRTVATGVIPSIIVSNLMGEAGAAFLVHDLPLWSLICIIILLAAALFVIIYLFMDRFCFRYFDETPDSPMYALIFAIVRLWHGRKPQPVIDDQLLSETEAPYILLANHESFFDFYYIHQLAHPRNPTYLVNEYYCTRPVLKTMAKKAGIIPKKLFTAEMSSPVRIMRSLKKGYPVVIFPEGRLSPDGRSNPIVQEGAAFYKRLNVDLVLVKIRGAYYSGPKWRSKRFRTSVSIKVERVIGKDELRLMSDEDLNSMIASVLFNDASKDRLCTYPHPGKAEGLEGILYSCYDCGSLYTTVGKGNEICCTACGSRHTFNEQYLFDDAPYSIPGWYETIREAEREVIDSFCLHTDVQTVIYGANGGRKRRETGECTLSPEAFTYRSDSIEFSIPTDKLPALAFSCNKEFELYHEGELYYFYPAENRQQVARWALLVDLLAERRSTGKP